MGCNTAQHNYSCEVQATTHAVPGTDVPWTPPGYCGAGSEVRSGPIRMWACCASESVSVPRCQGVGAQAWGTTVACPAPTRCATWTPPATTCQRRCRRRHLGCRAHGGRRDGETVQRAIAKSLKEQAEAAHDEKDKKASRLKRGDSLWEFPSSSDEDADRADDEHSEESSPMLEHRRILV